MRINLEKANAARKQKAYASRYNWQGKIMTLREILDSMEIVERIEAMRTLENHKRDGCYRKLDVPKTEYSLWDKNGTGINVPKLVYDDFLHVRRVHAAAE